MRYVVHPLPGHGAARPLVLPSLREDLLAGPGHQPLVLALHVRRPGEVQRHPREHALPVQRHLVRLEVRHLDTEILLELLGDPR